MASPSTWLSQLNTDATVRQGLSAIGIGAAIRNQAGLVVAAVSKPLVGMFSPEIAELLALREGLKQAQHLNLHVHLLEVDATNVAAGFHYSTVIGGEADLPLQNIKALRKDPKFCKC